MTDRHDDPLDPAVRAWYTAQPARQDWLAATARQISAVRPALWRRVRPRALAVAATAAVAALLLWAIIITSGLRTRTELARSVAALHAAPFTPDQGPARRFDDVQLPRLAFAPIEPERCRKEHYKVLGARATTLAGAPAAQIRLADDDGDVRTLCEFRDGPLASARDGHLTIDGTPVSVWHEAGLVMAMTGPPP